jgi:hypothetical protein
MWEEKLKINPGETLRLDKAFSKGFMAEEDIYQYSILNHEGEVVGSVIRTEHTAVRGFRKTHSVRQTDNNNAVVVNESWSGD